MRRALPAALLAVVSFPFLAATAFIGDDHVFLAYARWASSPFAAFVTDQHGGEYYRPLPMLLWWLLGRAGGGQAWPFALLALALHATCAALVVALGRALGASRAAAALAGALFLVAPAEIEAALWFSASTDLLATAAVLGAVVASLRGRAGVAAALALPAYLSKESALVLPLVVAAVHLPRGRRAAVRAAAPHAALALVYLSARFAVLRGLGGAGDPGAPALGRALQIGSGIVHALVGGVLPEALAWLAGGAALAWGVATAVRSKRWLPLAWIAIAVLPLPLAGWVVGERYFYLPAAGVALLLGDALASAGAVASGTAVASLLALALVAADARRVQVRAYRGRLDAVEAAVTAGVAQGHALFFVASGIKDVDLALKHRPALAPYADRTLVLGNVPASFALVPDALADRVRSLLAAPPLPPAGAYRFGARRIVGLARAEQQPTPSELRERLPELRVIQLRAGPGGAVLWRDSTPAP